MAITADYGSRMNGNGERGHHEVSRVNTKILNQFSAQYNNKVEQGRSARADNLIGGYSYTSQFRDQQKIAQVAKEYRRSMGNTTTPSYEDLEESRGEHQKEARHLALQNTSNMLMSAINPRDEDIRLAKQYKERIHGDVGGSWVLRAQMELATDEPEVAMTTGDPHTSLETQTKQEIFSPRAEHLQAGSSKVRIGGEIPLDAALRLERWAAQDKYAVSTTRFANESHPVGQYPEQTVTEPNLGHSLWPNHLGFRTDGLTYHRRETPKTFHENNQLEGPGWNARDPGNTAQVSEQQNQWETLGPGQVKWWNMAYAPPSGERNEFENEGFNFVRSRDDWDLSFSEDQLCPSALETHHPMPPLEKKEFTPLRNVKGRGKVVNPFARESSRQTSEPPRITEVPLNSLQFNKQCMSHHQ
ncbi:hypothetical protein GYMLUDRAFT_250250 [Collybiopsis luxurians FD-317 M1]|uniref:Uncharacterized protein n=1 Tax=Collybiopsis luxurians FD-317 M1 TaxID=944289 RepID=A0A0D0BG53_9AGAR|nr:hypothetical protein GYMLUDRAFT_250250 [Collybiopsis luxurians FD-317 M1]